MPDSFHCPAGHAWTAAEGGPDQCPQCGGVIHIWNMESAALQTMIQGHEFRVNSVVFSPDGARLATASLDQAIKIWDARTFQAVGTLVGHTDRVYSLAFSEDGRRLASGSFNQEVKVWDVASAQELMTLTTESGPVFGVAFRADGRQFATAHATGAIKIWEATQDFDKQGAEPLDVPWTRFHHASPDAYEKAADRLLTVPANGERRGQHWMAIPRQDGSELRASV